MIKLFYAGLTLGCNQRPSPVLLPVPNDEPLTYDLPGIPGGD